MAYHVLNRGAGKQDLFRKEEDYAAFLRIVDDVQQRIPVPVICFCLMPNHWHLVLRPRKAGQLSEFMRLVQVTHAQRYHARYKTVGTGPLYQGRFKSFPFDGDEYAGTVIRYVERNALRSGLCRRAEAWRWGSSHIRYTRGIERPDWLLPEEKWPVKVGRDYLKWLNRPQTDAEEAAMARSIQRGQPYGSAAWTNRVAKRLGLESTLRPRGRPSKRKAATGRTVVSRKADA
jgi:putative transposase